MIRVAHLIKGLGRGGAEMLLPHLAKTGGGARTVAVGYFLPWKDALVAALEQEGVAVTCFGSSSNLGVLASTGRVARWLRACDPDILHCHLPISGVVGRGAGRLAGIPVVYTEHNLQQRYHWLTRVLNRLTWRAQDQVVAVSQEVARSIAAHLPQGVPVQTVRNGVPEVDCEGEARDLPWGGEHMVIGTVAVFRQQKRLDVWIQVAREIAAQVPQARFVIVGDGPEREHVQAWITQAGLDDRVYLAGLQDEVAMWLNAMDVYLLTSEFEGLPLALLEAMMAGVPVVATPAGGIPEAITDGDNGVLRPLGDPGRLAAAVVELLRDAARRNTLAERGRATAIAQFGIQRMSDELANVYADVLAARSEP